MQKCFRPIPIYASAQRIFTAELSAQGCQPWRFAKVVPMHKAVDKVLQSSYRPILLSSACCKLLEPFLISHITQFLQPIQFSLAFSMDLEKLFQPLSFSGGAPFFLYLKNIREFGVIYLNFPKDFDGVRHQLLIIRMNSKAEAKSSLRSDNGIGVP